MIKQSMIEEEIKTHAQAHKKLKSEFERMHEEEGTPARVIKNGSRVCVQCEKSDLWCDCFLRA